MNILYSALDQQVPGTKGGSIHVQSVAEGLAALGNDVHVLTRRGPGGFPAAPRVWWHDMAPPLGRPQLRWMRAGAVARLAREIGANAIIERYYNFGGEGVRAAKRLGVPVMLEVNAPVVDYPGSPKRRLDQALLVEPMRRWREWQCGAADLIVTPIARIVPRLVERSRVIELEWGADTDLFRPGVAGTARFEKEAGQVTAVFAGAFRAWHGAARLVEAIGVLRERGERRLQAVLIGDGPEFERVRQMAARLDGVTLTGGISHVEMPAQLSAADIGVAPFDVDAHAPLSLGFYWSPLKVFEYMASGLPVVAPRIERLARIARDGQEALLYDPRDPCGLADCLVRLLDPALRQRLGTAGRERVVREFSWAAHCAQLDAALRKVCACGC
ncbi:MAG: glycosyltransferase family 4 protein [Bacteroidales bacterium]